MVGAMACGDPWQGGATWAAAQYVLGLRRLGHDVWLVEPVDGTVDSAYAREVTTFFDLEERIAFVERSTWKAVAGVSVEQLSAVRFDALLDVAGMLRDAPFVAEIPVRIYLDLDPAFTQLWQSAENIDMRLCGHTHFATVGRAIGTPACTVSPCGVDWIPTTPPVVLAQWPRAKGEASAYTTVGNWRSYGSIELDGVFYGQRAHSMRPFLELPQRLDQPCEVALAISPTETRDLDALSAHGWAIVNPRVAAGTPARYRAFVQRSRGELGLAKSGYVLSRCGWFSDRSACYLASGRPVVAQDTGSDVPPSGLGLLTFSTSDGAIAAIEEVERDYSRHSRAARELAEAHLDSDRVLPALLAGAGLA
jgi:hypothetical protein